MSEHNYIDEKSKKILIVSSRELLSIDESLSLLVTKSEFEGAVTLRPLAPGAVIGCSIDLIVKVAEAVLKMSEDPDEPKDRELEVSDVDLFVLREVAVSLVSLDESLSLALRRKIYELLMRPAIEAKAQKASELEFVENLITRSDDDGGLNQQLEDL